MVTHISVTHISVRLWTRSFVRSVPQYSLVYRNTVYRVPPYSLPLACRHVRVVMYLSTPPDCCLCPTSWPCSKGFVSFVSHTRTKQCFAHDAQGSRVIHDLACWGLVLCITWLCFLSCDASLCFLMCDSSLCFSRCDAWHGFFRWCITCITCTINPHSPKPVYLKRRASRSRQGQLGAHKIRAPQLGEHNIRPPTRQERRVRQEQ